MINRQKLEAELWESADLLRAGSKLTSNQYCNLMRDMLWAELPECYAEISISEYRQRICEYIYTRYRVAA